MARRRAPPTPSWYGQTMPRRFFAKALLGIIVMALPACSGGDTLNARDVYTIVDEIDVAVRAEALVEPTVLLALDFATNATSPEAAAKLLTDGLIGAPCVQAVQRGANVSLVYSTTQYLCGTDTSLSADFNLSGEQTITFRQADGETTAFDTVWKGISNGYLTVDGTAHVTTTVTADASSEHLVNALSWVRASDGKSGHGNDDRTAAVASTRSWQAPTLTGLRTWESDSGSWELRPVDARLQGWSTGIPFVGTFAIITPNRLALSLSVTYGATGPRMTLTDGTHSYSFGISPNDGTPTE